MGRPVLNEAAKADYIEALRWYAERSPRAAHTFEEEFDRAVNRIAADPDQFPWCDGRHQFCILRRFPFQLIYRKVADRVEIVAVAHAKRKPGYWSER
jgi:plasmid stabilization system protein ParE